MTLIILIVSRPHHWQGSRTGKERGGERLGGYLVGQRHQLAQPDAGDGEAWGE